MGIDWEYEWCKCCERPNKIGFQVSDEDWEKIVEGEYNVLCYNCFENLSFKKKIPFKLISLAPVSRASDQKIYKV